MCIKISENAVAMRREIPPYALATGVGIITTLHTHR
jgi:hypothetical protein